MTAPSGRAATAAAILTGLAASNLDPIVSPNATDHDDVEATAGGVQPDPDTTADEWLIAFVTTHTRGPQTLEPGAARTRGTDG
ncbi:hypothetical protein GCM10011512_25780 [Tersicoccus solisilvae]|uniref:Uncharacterized protein n=1 Tax=Tersicoccus solisilvae TaxID=1882339 RepID=A0ABQ1PI05_9MICC|nr:hypothetical protein [Tersicoccus solisilvae]GGC97659.1 hypothetical protein GCM10011512_25780 [Tersicoccus solisilvae]